MFLSIINRFVITITPLLPLSFVRMIAKRYVAGENSQEALKIVQRLNENGYSVTLDILGEHSKNKIDAQSITDEYANLYERILIQKLDCNISIKPSHIGMNISKDCIFENITNLIETARQYGQFIRIDMEDSSLTDDTIRLFNDCKNN